MLTKVLETVLLIVLWYCHKRGKETRLEKERILTEQEDERLDAEYAARGQSETLTTTAPADASIEEVEAGIEEAEQGKQAALSEGDNTTTSSQFEIKRKPVRNTEPQSEA